MESKEIRKKAYGHFGSGLHCAEVISKTILEMFSGEPNPAVIRSASGFGGGIGGSNDELCGRENGGDSLKTCGSLIKAFKREFLNEFGSLHCQTLLNGFKEEQNPLGCAKLTAETTVILADLLDEFGLKDAVDATSFSRQPRSKVELGCCPFSAQSC
jgi:hypothetical protein